MEAVDGEQISFRKKNCLLILNTFMSIADHFIMKICFRWKAVKPLTHYMDYCINRKEKRFLKFSDQPLDLFNKLLFSFESFIPRILSIKTFKENIISDLFSKCLNY